MIYKIKVVKIVGFGHKNFDFFRIRLLNNSNYIFLFEKNIIFFIISSPFTLLLISLP